MARDSVKNSALGREVKRQAPSTDVKDYHRNDDVDDNAEAHHHTLGHGPGQAAPGNEFHEHIINHPGGGGGGPTEVWHVLGTPPSNAVGVDGDWGFVTTGADSGYVYEKVAGAWVFRVNVRTFVYNDHGAVAGTARIAGYGINIWRGSVFPTNSDLANDMIVWTG